MSTNTEALRGIRAFGPEHFEHLEGLIAERDQLLEALQNLLTYPLGTFQVAAAKAAIAKTTGQ